MNIQETFPLLNLNKQIEMNIGEILSYDLIDNIFMVLGTDKGELFVY